MASLRILITEMMQEDLPFLIDLWHTPEVMRYADEFPSLRGWSRSDHPQDAWAAYRERRTSLGKGYTQLVLRLTDGPRIGESFFTPLPEGYTFGRWQKPQGLLTLMGDIKLAPEVWGQGLGTEGMQSVVAWCFSQTTCSQLVVPPHTLNPAAERVYEKAGFELYTGMRSWHNHKIMELTRARYESLFSPPSGPSSSPQPSIQGR